MEPVGLMWGVESRVYRAHAKYEVLGKGFSIVALEECEREQEVRQPLSEVVHRGLLESRHSSKSSWVVHIIFTVLGDDSRDGFSDSGRRL